MLCCCTLVVPQCSLLRPSEEVSFVLLRKLRFVDSEAGFSHRCLTLLEHSSRVGLSLARGGCVFLLRPGEERFGVE